MKKSLLKILSVIFSCLFVLSCSNLISGDNSGAGYNSFEKVNIRGTIGVKGALPASIANARSFSAAINGRTAIPTIPEESEYYFFKTRDLDSGEVDNAAGYAESDGSYSVGLVIGRRYEVTAGISSDTEHENVILSTSWETPLVTRENASSLGKDILLEPGTEGNGTVFLLIKVSASNIASVIDCSNDKFKLTRKEGSTNEYYLSQNGENIQCGSYEVTLKFYDETSNTCLYYNTQTINVFSDLQTGKWRSGGGSLDPIDASGSYNVTNELVEKFARSQIYVGSTTWGNASSSGNGSAKLPYDTFLKAIDYIKISGDASVDYTIWISGEIKENASIGAEVNSKAHSITISGTRGNDRDSLNGDNSGSVLTISTSVPVTIKNILITGGRASYGGGINMDSGTNVILESDALIDGNYASESGGGIYSKGTLVLKSGSIVGRQVSSTATNSSYSNYATTGGGISFAGGTVTLEKDSVVSYNFAYQGGGIQCSFSSYSASYVLSITGAEIAYNGCDPKIRFSRDCSWNSYGGGIFANGCKFAASAIKLHDNYGSDGGGGLFLQNCNSGEMTDGNVFDNTMHADGYSEATDVLLFDACSLSLKDCQVSNKNNVSNGVKVRSSTSYLELKGSTVISSNTPVLLSSGTYITVSDNLTGTSPVATLTLENWKRGISVIKADGTNISDLTTITDVTEKFKCTNELFSTLLSDDNKSLYLDAPIYVSENSPADTTKPEGSKEHPYTSISAASVEMNDKDTDYLIYIVGELRASQSLPTTLTKESHAKSITIKGYDTTASINGKLNTASPLSIKTNVPVTIMNLTITEGKNSGIKIWESDSNVTLGNGAKITGNSSNNGGGIYNAGNLKILSGAEISGNTANNFGGGIYNTYVVTMEGGIISGNTNAAIHNEGVVKLSGSAYIPAGTDNSNVVYLSLNTKISITGSLTPPEEANGIVAIIKPQSYDSELFEAGTGVTLANEVGKFRIVQPEGTASLGTGLEYGFDSTGKYTTSEVKVVPLDNDMDEIKTAINTLISNSTEPVNLCFTSDFTPVGADRNYTISINGKTVNITAPSPVTLKLDATYHYQNLFEVKNGGKLYIGKNIKLQGNNSGCNYVVDLEKNSGSEVILDGVEITGWRYSGGGAIVYVPEGTVLRIKGNTKIHHNLSIINVYGGTVYMDGGEICNNNLDNIQDAVIIIQKEGKFIKKAGAGRIYNNKGYRNGKAGQDSQVKFYGFYGGGYWGPDEDNLKAYKTGNSGTTDDHFFITESDVEAASQ